MAFHVYEIPQRLIRGSFAAVLDGVEQIGIGFVEYRTEVNGDGWYGIRFFGELAVYEWPAASVWRLS
jgi:hypothetical protein